MVFDTSLGWMAVVGEGRIVRQLSFGHGSPQQALAAVSEAGGGWARVCQWNAPLARRLRRYAAGQGDDFLDVLVPPRATAFQQRVVELCRRIPPGSTVTYGCLAAAAGRAAAARAVGNVMRTNPVPLIVPCHRVVGAGGGLGGYSAPAGLGMKRRLLELEASAAGLVGAGA